MIPEFNGIVNKLFRGKLAEEYWYWILRVWGK